MVFKCRKIKKAIISYANSAMLFPEPFYPVERSDMMDRFRPDPSGYWMDFLNFLDEQDKTKPDDIHYQRKRYHGK